ncbi:MAG: hypothetical protein ABWX84_09245 [Nocardioides sp.]
MYLFTLHDSRGSWITIVTQSFEEIPYRIRHDGRFAPLTFVTQRVAYLGVSKFAIATGSSVVVGVAATKLLGFALAVVSFRAVAATLRVRLRRNQPVQELTRSSVAAGTVLFAVIFACGVQTQGAQRGSWVAYSALTWPTIAVCLLTVWATLRLTNRLASKPRALLSTLVPLALIGAALNASYEIYYVAAPLALLVLWTHQPPTGVAPPESRWKNPKVLAGGALGLSFLVSFIAVRSLIAFVCSGPSGCYQGTKPEVGLGALVTAWRNLATSVPVFGRSEAAADLDKYVPGGVLAGPGQGAGWFIAALLLLALVGLWLTRSQVSEPATEESHVWLVLGLTGLAMAIGTALAMGASLQAQDVITALGQPYRNTTAAWAGIAMGVTAVSMVLLQRAEASRTPAGTRAPDARVGGSSLARLSLAAIPVCLVVLWAGVVVWPVNSQMSRVGAAAPSSVTVHNMVMATLRPDLGPKGDRARCKILSRVRRDVNGVLSRQLIPQLAKANFRMLWGRPFCSRGTSAPSSRG